MLGQLVHGTPVEEELEPYREELVDAGMVDGDGWPLPFLRELTHALAAPAVTVNVETCGPDGLVGHGAGVNSGQQAYMSVGWPHDSEVEYAPVQPKLLAAELAHIVAFRSADIAAMGPWEVSAPLHLIEGTLTALGVFDRRDYWAVAQDEIPGIVDAHVPGMDSERRHRVAAVLASIRLSWRVTVSWPDEDAQEGWTARGLVALDCGELGYWRRDLPEKPLAAGDISPETQVRLVNVDAATLWTDLGGLIPQRDKSSAARTG